MRIAPQSNIDTSIQQNLSKAKSIPLSNIESKKSSEPQDETLNLENVQIEKKVPEEKLDEAIKSINEFLELSHKATKFVKHEGLDKYYVRLVDAETEEVIKEIPPERLLDAFYEMQKLVGMVVDEKI